MLRVQPLALLRTGWVRPGVLPRAPTQPRHGPVRPPTHNAWAAPQTGTRAPRSAERTSPETGTASHGPAAAAMAFWAKAGASWSLIARGKYGVCCQSKIYPFLSFSQLSNVFDFSQALSVAGI